MIAGVRGTLRTKGSNYVVVDIGPLDLMVFVPASILEQEMDLGDPIELHTHLHVRDSEWALYGFETLEARRLFESLLGVSGIGPRLALSLLSTFSPEVLAGAIAQGNAEALARAPGVGKKAAQRIVLQLQEKVGGMGMAEVGAPAAADIELVEALRSLGYSVVEAQRVVQLLPKDVADLEERLRLALIQLGRG